MKASDSSENKQKEFFNQLKKKLRQVLAQFLFLYVFFFLIDTEVFLL
ncbi:hypothetical protein RV05_GL002026 [Enterococcus hirae]|nr:hypothetical protein RV05_GL002026 [Enterococcus hirae]